MAGVDYNELCKIMERKMPEWIRKHPGGAVVIRGEEDFTFYASRNEASKDMVGQFPRMIGAPNYIIEEIPEANSRDGNESDLEK